MCMSFYLYFFAPNSLKANCSLLSWRITNLIWH